MRRARELLNLYPPHLFKYYASPVRGAPRHSVATKGTPVLHANESPTLESVGPFTLRTPSFFGENTFLGALVT